MPDTLEARDFANPENNGTFVTPMSEDTARFIASRRLGGRTMPFEACRHHWEAVEAALERREHGCRVCMKIPPTPVAPKDPFDTDTYPAEPLCVDCAMWAAKFNRRALYGRQDTVSAIQHEREPGLHQSRTRLVGELGRRLAASPRFQST